MEIIANKQHFYLEFGGNVVSRLKQNETKIIIVPKLVHLNSKRVVS